MFASPDPHHPCGSALDPSLRPPARAPGWATPTGITSSAGFPRRLGAEVAWYRDGVRSPAAFATNHM